VSERSALELWRLKLESFQKEEALAVDPEQKFALAVRIGETQAKIRELESHGPAFEPAASNRAAPSQLSYTADRLFGREQDLARLLAYWEGRKTRLVTIVAFGGVGKTSLVARFAAELSDRNYDGADYFDWSFYSQGTRGTSTASADAFIDAALRFFGDEEAAESARGGWEKGSRLAAILASRRALLVLDGLEPLQYPPGPLAGELKDPAMQALLRGLAAKNAGLCVVTTREKVAGLGRFDAAAQWELDSLSTEAGIDLLESLGIDGSAAEMQQAEAEVEGHALTLHLLGGYLRDAHGGDVRKRDRVGFVAADAETSGGHAFRVMGAYEGWLEAAGTTRRRDLAVLRLLGLFDRPASAECLAALRRPPAIEGLTEALFEKVPGWRGWFRKPLPVGEEEWRLSVQRLASCQLVVAGEDGSVDAHPLIREYFASRLRDENPKAWRVAHGRIFDYLKDGTPQFPVDLPGLQPLYQAVFHGCQAGRHQEACHKVYHDRIQRCDEAYSSKKLGAIGADLGAIVCFFEKPWSRLAPSLSDLARAWLLNEAAFSLRALGRLREALEPMRAGLEGAARLKNWYNAAQAASNLSDIELTLGEVQLAVADAEQAVAFADRSGNAFVKMGFRTTLANAQHQAGEKEAALALFHEAERLQAERQPVYPLVYSVQGFRYCDLLLAWAERAAGSGRDVRAPSREEECSEVERRAAGSLEIARQNNWLLDIALDRLSLGRARLYRAVMKGGFLSVENAGSDIEKAIAGLRDAGQIDYIPRGLLTRAWLRRLNGDADGAKADLDEAQEIAKRGSMKLHLADIALYRARLFHDRVSLVEARRLVEGCGYGRRLPEIADLEAESAKWD
jgi:tetratricopeptide (TPR) repeat protein